MMNISINNEIKSLSRTALDGKIKSLTNIGEIKSSKEINSSEKVKIAKAARGFEAIFINMMIKEMKNAMLEENESDSSFGADTLNGYSDMLLAEQISNITSGLGIAAMLYQHFTGEKLEPVRQVRSPMSSNAELPEIIHASIKKVLSNINDKIQTNIPQRINDRIATYKSIINKASEKFGIPVNVIESVIAAESAGRNDALSKAGAKGLMQLMDGTAKGLGVTNSYDPEQNIMGGTLYLRQMLDKFDGDIELALAAYNAGPGNVMKYGGIPPFKETKAYVKRIKNYLNNDTEI